MTRLIYVTVERDAAPLGGRALLSDLNERILGDLFGRDMQTYRLPKRKIAGVGGVLRGIAGHLDGVDRDSIEGVLNAVRRWRAGRVFLDGSNLGLLAAAVKQDRPDVRVTTFFHNVEARFFLGSLRQTKSPKALAVLAGNYVAERRAVRSSDELICLSGRDSDLLKRCYGRRATHISAISLVDRFGELRAGPVAEGRYALFVGGTFYANVAGVRWFAEHVAPFAALKTYVVGNGFEAHRAELERFGNIEVVGRAEALGDWYDHADVVIAPIFDGSGMKTKVAEALMFGKPIIGTPESFVGYEIVSDRAGHVCSTPAQFIDALNSLASRDAILFDPALRRLYEDQYSYRAALARMAGALGLVA